MRIKQCGRPHSQLNPSESNLLLFIFTTPWFVPLLWEKTVNVDVVNVDVVNVDVENVDTVNVDGKCRCGKCRR